MAEGKYARKKRVKHAASRPVLDAQRKVDGSARRLAEQVPLDGTRAMTGDLVLGSADEPETNTGATPKAWVEGRLSGKANEGHGHSKSENWFEHGHDTNDNWFQHSHPKYLTKEEADNLYQRK